MFSNIFSETTGPAEAKFHVEGTKVYSNGPGHLLFFIIVNLRAGAFSRDFTTDLSPQCRAFSRALKTEKLKAPLFPGPYMLGLQMTGALYLNSSSICI